MSVLVRKINLAKWRKTDIASGAPICADAITGCMKTYDNTLSVWAINSVEEIDDAAVAIAASLEHLDKIDLITLSPEELNAIGIKSKETPGQTAAKSMQNTHRDLIELNYAGLGDLSEVIRKVLNQNASHRYTQAKLKKLLKDAVDNGVVDPDLLQQSVRQKLET